jgi:nucleoid-associated protein YgaU
VAIYRFSRYLRADPHKDSDGNIFVDFPAPIELEKDGEDDLIYQVKEGDTLFSIAYRFYEDTNFKSKGFEVRPSGFWWIIAEVNNIVDATQPLKAGTTLVIPSISRIQFEVISGR